MKTLFKFLLTILAAFTFGSVLAEEARPNGPAQPSKTEYFTSELASVLLARQAPVSVFALSLAPNKPLPAGSTVSVEFENPMNPDLPFIVPAELNRKGELHVQSPKFEGIKIKKAYLARTKVLGPELQVLSVHDQWIWFDMPDAMRKVYATKVID
jgi:hypothetical protein